MGLFSSDSGDSEYSEERVDELIEKSTGNVTGEHLTKSSGTIRTYLYNGPLINHLKEGEQPEFVFTNGSDGYRIRETDGNERTPHHRSAEGKRYLIVTDQRILYIAGCKDGDESIEHSYEKIVSIEGASKGINKKIRFESGNGEAYYFAPIKERPLIEPAVKYISEQLSKTGSKSGGTETSESSVNSVGPSTADTDPTDETEATGEGKQPEIKHFIRRHIEALCEDDGEFMDIYTNSTVGHEDSEVSDYQILDEYNLHNLIALSDEEFTQAEKFLQSKDIPIVDDDMSLLFDTGEVSIEESAEIAETTLRELYGVSKTSQVDIEIEGAPEPDVSTESEVSDGGSDEDDNETQEASSGGENSADDNAEIELRAGIVGRNVSDLEITEEIPEKIITQTGSDMERHILSRSIETSFYEYKKISQVSASKDSITIGDATINLKDVLDARYIETQEISGTSWGKLQDCPYIGLTIAEDEIPSEKSSENYEGPRSDIYLIGSPSKIRYHGRTEDYDHRYELTETLNVTRNELSKLCKFINSNLESPIKETYVLQDYVEDPSNLKVEGWQKSGATSINAGIDGDVNTTGTSSGVQVGPFTRSSSESEGKISAELGGSIDDNSFTSRIDYLQVSEDGIYVEADPILDFDFSTIDQVLRRDKGFSIKAKGTTYTIVGESSRVFDTYGSIESPLLEDAIEYMENKVAAANDSNEPTGDSESTSDKLKELKELYEADILTDEEFSSKKQELLDDF